MEIPRADRVEVFDCGFGAGADVKFLVNVLQMAANGFGADAKPIGDFLVSQALGDQLGDGCFALGEADGLRFVRGLRGIVVEGLDDPPRDFGTHWCAAGMDV